MSKLRAFTLILLSLGIVPSTSLAESRVGMISQLSKKVSADGTATLTVYLDSIDGVSAKMCGASGSAARSAVVPAGPDLKMVENLLRAAYVARREVILSSDLIDGVCRLRAFDVFEGSAL